MLLASYIEMSNLIPASDLSSTSDDSEMDGEQFSKAMKDEQADMMKKFRRQKRAREFCAMGIIPPAQSPKLRKSNEVNQEILVESDEEERTRKNHATMTGNTDRSIKNKKDERESMVGKFGEIMADYSAVPPPSSLQQGHGMYTIGKDGQRVKVRPPSTDSDLDLKEPGVQFEKKVGDMVHVCALNKKGNYIEVGRRIEGDDPEERWLDALYVFSVSLF